MCGIYGIFAYASPDQLPDTDEVDACLNGMQSRGPDGRGTWQSENGRLLIGHTRLAIIDLSPTGAQPMVDPEGDVVVSFNGEIYNYRSLRRSLEKEGHLFRTSSDTETILKLYRKHGSRFVEYLQGMFAIALWDTRAKRLLLARDPHGIKPLYYRDDGSTIRFSSTMRQLLEGDSSPRRLHPRGFVSYLAWGYVPESASLVQGVKAIPAGSILEVGLTDQVSPPRVSTYWTVAQAYAHEAPDSRIKGRFGLTREALLESVERHLVADVPVGLFLSSGVDSAALLGMASDLGAELHTATLAFDEFRGTLADESLLASEVAKYYGAPHETITLSSQDVRRLLPQFFTAMDQPTVDGLNTFLISWAVRRAGFKTALSGLGGDELFGGYPTFSRYQFIRRMDWTSKMPCLKQLWPAVSQLLGPSRRRHKMRFLPSALEDPRSTYYLLRGVFTPHEIRRLVGRSVWENAGGLRAILECVDEMTEVGGDSRTQIATAEQVAYMRGQLLRDADWASMAHGLEVRMPLVDRRLTERIGHFLATWKRGEAKKPLAMAPKEHVPSSILDRPKTGFTTPMRAWLPALSDHCSGELSSLLSPAGATKATKLLSDIQKGRSHWSRGWTLLVLAEYVRRNGLSW